MSHIKSRRPSIDAWLPVTGEERRQSTHSVGRANTGPLIACMGLTPEMLAARIGGAYNPSAWVRSAVICRTPCRHEYRHLTFRRDKTGDRATGGPTISPRYGFHTRILRPMVANTYLATTDHAKGVPQRQRPCDTDTTAESGCRGLPRPVPQAGRCPDGAHVGHNCRMDENKCRIAEN